MDKIPKDFTSIKDTYYAALSDISTYLTWIVNYNILKYILKYLKGKLIKLHRFILVYNVRCKLATS